MNNVGSTTLVRASNQAWSATSSASLNSLTTVATWEFWIKPTSSIGSGALWGMVTKDDVNTQRTFAIDYYNPSTPRIRVSVNNSGGAVEENTLTTTLTVNTWTHVAITYDGSLSLGSRFVFFINGVSQGSGSLTFGTGVTSIVTTKTAKYVIGGYDAGGIYADAKFDEVRLWNVKRTNTEISDNYRTEISPSTSGLQAYHQFKGVALDSTSNANNLTAVGSPTYTNDVPFGGETKQLIYF